MNTTNIAGALALLSGSLLLISSLIGAGTPSLRRLTIALRTATAATILSAATLVALAMNIPHGGWIYYPLIWLPLVPGKAWVVWSLARRRSAKGQLVVAEAERTVRNFRPEV